MRVVMAKVRRIIAKISPVPYYECAWRTSGAHPIVAAGGDIVDTVVAFGCMSPGSTTKCRK